MCEQVHNSLYNEIEWVLYVCALIEMEYGI